MAFMEIKPFEKNSMLKHTGPNQRNWQSGREVYCMRKFWEMQREWHKTPVPIPVEARLGKLARGTRHSPQSPQLKHNIETHSIHVNKLPETRLGCVP